MSGCLLLCRQRERPAIWLTQEGIYILNMPRSWHGLPSTISLRTGPVESLIPWQEGRLIPCIWHWTCLSALLVLAYYSFSFFFKLCTKLHLSFSHQERNSPQVWMVWQFVCFFSSTSLLFYSSTHLPCLSPQGQKGYPGPPGLPGEPVSIFVHFMHRVFHDFDAKCCASVILHTPINTTHEVQQSHNLQLVPEWCNVII